jgi:hypothetical protein
VDWLRRFATASVLLDVTNKLTPSKIRSFHAAIGRFVLTWAEVETYLDLLVLKLRKPDQKLPHQLAGKIQFIRAALQTERGRGYEKEASKMIDEIEGLADTRHDYVHGSRIGFSVERSVLHVKLGRLLQPTSKPRRKAVQVTAAEIENTTSRLYEVGGELLDLLESMVRSKTD